MSTQGYLPKSEYIFGCFNRGLATGIWRIQRLEVLLHIHHTQHSPSWQGITGSQEPINSISDYIRPNFCTHNILLLFNRRPIRFHVHIKDHLLKYISIYVISSQCNVAHTTHYKKWPFWNCQAPVGLLQPVDLTNMRFLILFLFAIWLK